MAPKWRLVAGDAIIKATFEGVTRMKAMWLGFAVAIAIAAIAGVALNEYGESSAERFSTADTRL